MVLLFRAARRQQTRKEAFEQRKRELKALGLGQDGRPMKKEDEKKETKSRGKVGRHVICVVLGYRTFVTFESRESSFGCLYNTIITCYKYRTILPKVLSVSYTHLTLPTILLV